MSSRPCSYPKCGKPTAYLPVNTEDTTGMQWRHVDPADEEASRKPGFMHVGYPMSREPDWIEAYEDEREFGPGGCIR